MRYIRVGGLIACMGLTQTGCGKDPAEFFRHPDVDSRVQQSLSGTLNPRSGLTLTDPDVFSFAMFSDIHIKPSNATTLLFFKQDVAKYNIAFFSVLGDLTEDGNNQEYADAKKHLDAVGIPYYVTIGNHDLFQSGTAGGWKTWSTTFGPATYEVTIASRVRLLFLDTSSDEVGASQFRWLEDNLQETAPVTIVGSHYPIYDGVSPSIWRISSLEERVKLTSLLNRYQAYAFVAGHMHGYRESMLGNVHHFILGSMFPGCLDEGEHGYVLFTYDHGKISYQHIVMPFPG